MESAGGDSQTAEGEDEDDDVEDEEETEYESEPSFMSMSGRSSPMKYCKFRIKCE